MQCVLQALEYIFLAPRCLLEIKQTTKPHADKVPTIRMYSRIFYSLFISRLIWHFPSMEYAYKTDQEKKINTLPQVLIWHVHVYDLKRDYITCDAIECLHKLTFEN